MRIDKLGAEEKKLASEIERIDAELYLADEFIRAKVSMLTERINSRFQIARFKLAEDATILVSEVACGLPGCPPLETVVAFWTEGDTRHHFKVFKRVAEVVPDDLPPTWLKDALIAVEGEGLECC